MAAAPMHKRMRRMDPTTASGTVRGLRVLVLIALLGVSMVAATPIAGPAPGAGSAPYVEIALTDPPITFASTATDGVLFIAVPRGTNAAREVGGFGYLLPTTIRLIIGDRVVITNHDLTPHLILWAFLAPGETVTRTFSRTGSETYSAGCSVDTTVAGWTTMFISRE